ncbi:Sensor histidine kinase [hydrothermal vent metagenome]|uniref:histidine kinase n=1 Tax=hydrothermal vent metagenome TaxID=652676 RepID=A0A3B1ADP4_9ZZZZ
MYRSYRDANHEVQELFDAQLAQSSRSLQAIILYNIEAIDNFSAQEILNYPITTANTDPINEYDLRDTHSYERKMAFQVWDNGKRLVLRSASAPIIALNKNALTPKARGFSDVMLNNEKWRVFSLWDKQFKHLIQVGERYAIRDELTSEIVKHLLLPSITSIPILALMIWFGIGRGLSPLRKVAKEVTRRDTAHLEPIKLSNVPLEILPVIEELNALFHRVHTAIEKERQFTDDAAHELRTPLAALKVQAQVAKAAKNSEEKSSAIDNIIAGVDRATHLVQQMLVLARLGSKDNSSAKINSIHIRATSEELIAQLALRAIEKNITLSFQCDDNYIIDGEKTNYEILLANIVDNAINYTPNDGNIVIKITDSDNNIKLTVTDNGIGIAEKNLERVFERYYRVRDSAADGCGLGLTISRQCAEQLNAVIKFTKPKTEVGLKVSISFPKQSLI